MTKPKKRPDGIAVRPGSQARASRSTTSSGGGRARPGGRPPRLAATCSGVADGGTRRWSRDASHSSARAWARSSAGCSAGAVTVRLGRGFHSVAPADLPCPACRSWCRSRCWRGRSGSPAPRRTPRGSTRYVGPHLSRRAGGVKHPVHDFLFTYYSQRPAQLRRWHPGYGVRLADAAEYAGLRGTTPAPSRRRTSRRRRRCSRARQPAARHRVAGRRTRAASGCTSGRWSTGQSADEVRHADWPLRLGRDGHRRRRRVAPDPVLALRRVPLLHRAGASAQHAPARARRPGRRTSSRAACTPGWTSTSTPSGSPR